MSKKDPRITAYVAKAPPFARPVLRAIRAAVHAGCPAVEETVKWRMPSFVHHGLIGGMAAFKAHCTLWFWRGRHLPSLGPDQDGAMGQFGRLSSAADLPSKARLVRLVREAAALNEALAAAPRVRKARKPARAGARPKVGKPPARKGRRTA